MTVRTDPGGSKAALLRAVLLVAGVAVAAAAVSDEALQLDPYDPMKYYVGDDVVTSAAATVTAPSAAPGGAAAIAALTAAGKLGLAAARADTTPAGLQQLLLRDKDLKLQTHTNRLFYSCSFGGAGHSHSHSQTVGSVTAASVSAQAIGDQTGPADPAVANWNKLHSRPGSTKTFYLDVSGCQVPASLWDPNPISQTPFSLDGDTSSLSDEEKAAIVQIWRTVAADFIELDVDVTTEPTPMSKILRTSADDAEHGVRVCIGGPVLDMSAGGVSFLHSFAYWNPFWDEASNWGLQPAWIFSSQMEPQDIAVAISHEIGHTLGLTHDGCDTQPAGDQEYFKGTADKNWGPIMGAPYGVRLATFDRGEYSCYINNNGTQNDYNVMTRPQFLTYAPDDGVGSTTATALSLCSAIAGSSCEIVDATTTRARADALVSVAEAGGVDKNVFKLQAGAGQIRAAVSVVPPVQLICPCASGGPCPDGFSCLCAKNDGNCYSPAPAASWYRSNLLFQLEILSAAGAVVAGPVSSNYDASTTLDFTAAAPGTFYVQVTPVPGTSQPSLYGSGGAFTLEATFPTPPLAPVLPANCTAQPPTNVANAATWSCALPAADQARCDTTCDATFSGSPFATCSNSTWLVTGSCTAVPPVINNCTAQPPTNVANAATWSCALPAANQARCDTTCDATFSGSPSATCSNGTWLVTGSCTAVPPVINNCTSQPSPAADNAAAWACPLPAASNSSCSATCLPGFSGSIIRVCVNGAWQPATGSCSPSPCTTVPSQTLANAAPWPQTCAGTASGASCPGQCIPGFAGTIALQCSAGVFTPSGSCTPSPLTLALSPQAQQLRAVACTKKSSVVVFDYQATATSPDGITFGKPRVTSDQAAVTCSVSRAGLGATRGTITATCKSPSTTPVAATITVTMTAKLPRSASIQASSSSRASFTCCSPVLTAHALPVSPAPCLYCGSSSSVSGVYQQTDISGRFAAGLAAGVTPSSCGIGASAGTSFGSLNATCDPATRQLTFQLTGPAGGTSGSGIQFLWTCSRPRNARACVGTGWRKVDPASSAVIVRADGLGTLVTAWQSGINCSCSDVRFAVKQAGSFGGSTC